MSEELNGDFRIFRGRLNDGSTLTFKVQWQGYADFHWHESGRASTWDHPFDDRRCHWSAAGRIVRSVAVVVAGHEYWRDDLTTAFHAERANQGSALQLAKLRPENCNDCAARRDSDFANMRAQVNGALAGTIEQDLPVVLNSLRSMPDIVELQPVS